MAGAVDLFGGSSSISGVNLFRVDKSPLEQLNPNAATKFLPNSTIPDVPTTLLEWVVEIISGLAEVLEDIFPGIDFSHGPIAFVISVINRFFQALDDLANAFWGVDSRPIRLDWTHGPIAFFQSLFEAVIIIIEDATRLDFSNGLLGLLQSIFNNFFNTVEAWVGGTNRFHVDLMNGPLRAWETFTNAVQVLLEDLTGLDLHEGPIGFALSIFWAVVHNFENWTGIDLTHGPLAFFVSLVRAIENLLNINTWIQGFEDFTGLNIDEGPIHFLRSIFTRFNIPFFNNLITILGLDILDTFPNPIVLIEQFFSFLWGTIDQGIIKSFIDWFEELTGLDVRNGPLEFLHSLADVVVEAITGFFTFLSQLFGIDLVSGQFDFFTQIQIFLGNILAAPIQVLGEFLEALEATGYGLANGLANLLFDIIGIIPIVGSGLADALRTGWQNLINWLRGGTQAATNLIKDPGAELSGAWVSQSSNVIQNTNFSFRRSGGTSLLMTSGGATEKAFYWNVNDLGATAPIKTQVGEVYYVECYVLYPLTGNTGPTGTVTLVAEFSKSTDPTDTVVSTYDHVLTRSNTSWAKVSAGVITPGGTNDPSDPGYDRVSFGLRLGANKSVLGDKFYVDDMLVKETTQAQNTLDGIHQAIYGGDGTLRTVQDVKDAVGGVTDLSRGVVESGSNLVKDGKVQLAKNWTGLATGVAVSGLYSRSTPNSVDITSGGATERSFDFTVDDTAKVKPISTTPDSTFYCECWVFSPSSNSATAVVTLRARAYNFATKTYSDSITPTTSGSAAAIINPTRGQWTKVYGYFKVPDYVDPPFNTKPSDGFVAGIRLAPNATTANNHFYIDDMVIQDVTHAANINTALYSGSPRPASTISADVVPTLSQAKVDGLGTALAGASGAAADAVAAASGAKASAQTTVDGIHQAVTGTTATNQPATSVKTNFGTTISSIINGLRGGGTSSKSDWSATDLLSTGTDTSKSIAGVAATVAQIIAQNSSNALNGFSYEVNFASYKNASSLVNFTPNYGGGGSGYYYVSGGVAQVLGASSTGDNRNSFNVYSFATNSIYQRVGVTLATTPGGPPWFVAEGAFNYIIARSNGVNPNVGGSYCMYAKIGYGSAQIIEVINGSHTARQTYSGTFRAKAGATYWLQAGNYLDNRPHQYTLYENANPLLIADSTFAHTSKQAGFGGAWQTFWYGLGPYAMLPGQVGGWYAYDNMPATTIGSGFQATRSATTALQVSVPYGGIQGYYTGSFPSNFWSSSRASGACTSYGSGFRVSVTGWYAVACRVDMTSGTVALAVNGTVVQRPTFGILNHIVYLNKNDVVEMKIEHTSNSCTVAAVPSLGGTAVPASYFIAAFLNNATPTDYTEQLSGAGSSIDVTGSYGLE